MYPRAKMTDPLSGKDRLIVNTLFIQILLIINRSHLPFSLSKLSSKDQLYVAQMGVVYYLTEHLAIVK